jgi:steroid delta-isomerase-like uncharacterized protein
MAAATFNIPDQDPRLEKRVRLVEEHVKLENDHDLAGILGTFGAQAAYDDEPWNDRRRGRDQVEAYYRELLTAMPDLRIEIEASHAAADAVILETIISGSHRGIWRGLPPTGRSLEFPLCGIFTFDQDDRLSGERIYYDKAGVLQQLGLLHDPMTKIGGLVTGLTHPITIAKAYGRRLLNKRNG